MIEHFMSYWGWYRQRRGGLWFYVYPRPFPYMRFWTRRPYELEIIIRMELWE